MGLPSASFSCEASPRLTNRYYSATSSPPRTPSGSHESTNVQASSTPSLPGIHLVQPSSPTITPPLPLENRPPRPPRRITPTTPTFHIPPPPEASPAGSSIRLVPSLPLEVDLGLPFTASSIPDSGRSFQGEQFLNPIAHALQPRVRTSSAATLGDFGEPVRSVGSRPILSRGGTTMSSEKGSVESGMVVEERAVRGR